MVGMFIRNMNLVVVVWWLSLNSMVMKIVVVECEVFGNMLVIIWVRFISIVIF